MYCDPRPGESWCDLSGRCYRILTLAAGRSESGLFGMYVVYEAPQGQVFMTPLKEFIGMSSSGYYTLIKRS
jgi:hypothetical protein